jgi:hypothetical protein
VCRLYARVGYANSVHAAARYSWMSPPSRSRRSTRAVGECGICSWRARGSGGFRSSDRWPAGVVVVGEDAEDALEVASVHDQEPVEAFGPDGANEALGGRIRLRRSHRRLDDPDAFAGEDGVEVAGELAVAVADQKAKRSRSLVERPGELARLLGDPWSGRVGGAAGEVDAPATQLDEEEHVQPLQRDRLDGEEVDREHALRLCP